MKKPNQLIALIFSILLILLFVSCPGATGVMYSLTLSCPDATASGTTVLYYSSIEDAWYGDVSATQRATKIEAPVKRYVVNFGSVSETLAPHQEFVEKFDGYYVGGVGVVDRDNNILDNLKPTINMTAVVSWVVEKEVILPDYVPGENKVFIGWKEVGAQDDSATPPGTPYTPVSVITYLVPVIKDKNQYKITLNPGENVSGDNKGTTEIWYNAYDRKFYNGKNKDPEHPGEPEEEERTDQVLPISTIEMPKISRTIKYIVNPDNAPDINVSSPKDYSWSATFGGYGTLVDSNANINGNAVIQQDETLTASWSNIQTVKLEEVSTGGYTFLGWREADGTEIRLGSPEFQAYTPKLENNELKAIWANGKTWTLNLSHDGATSKQYDSLYFKVADSGRGGTWYKKYGNDESKVDALLEAELPQKVTIVTLDLQKGEFVPPSEEGEDDIDRSTSRSVKWDFGGYFVSENGVQSMVINPSGEFKDESGALSGIYDEGWATAKWSATALSLPTNEVLKRSGYTLTGWKDSKGKVYKDTYTPGVTKETLTAVWTPNVYTLKLNLNENEFTKRGDETVYYRTDDRWYSEYSVSSKKDANRVIARPERIYSISYNTKYESVSYVPSKAEYKFLGYYDANDENKCYIDASGKIVVNSIITDDPSIVVEAIGKWGDANVELPLPTVPGYDFIGWKERDGESYPILPRLYNPTVDITLYATWKETNYNDNVILEYGDGCDATLGSIVGVENIALNNGEGASITIRLPNNAKFIDSLDNNKVKNWFIYNNEQGITNDFGNNLQGKESEKITIKNGGAGYNFVTVLIKGWLALAKMQVVREYSTNIVIPQSDIQNNYSGDVSVMMKYQVKDVAEMYIYEDEAFVGTNAYPIMGSMNERLGNSSTGVTMKIQLMNAVFSDNLGQVDVENWFNDLSVGLGGKGIKYRIDKGGASSDYVDVIISGVPAQRERNRRTVTIPFKDLKGGTATAILGGEAPTLTKDAYYDTKFFQKAFEINLTASEQQGAKDDWSGEVIDQNMSFIFLPGNLDWPVVWEQQDVASPKETATIREDVAIADIEVTGGFFMTVLKWAENNGYKFDFRNTNYKLGYNQSEDLNNSLHPVVGVSWYNAIVFCNAITEWYNATKNTGTPLTCAYVIGGVQGGTPIRDATNTLELDKIDPKQHLSLASSYYPHVVGSTGFRLPTRTEWQYAASVSPTKVDKSLIKDYVGIDLPKVNEFQFFAQAYDTISGKNANFSSTGTREVGKYVAKENANSIALYDVSGNAFEWAEDMEAIGYRYLNGGGWNYDGAEYTIGSYVRRAPGLPSTSDANGNNTGFRLCRNIFNNF